MKVKVLNTGEVVEAKRFKDMTDKEKNNSTADKYHWDEEDLFIEPRENHIVWRYVFNREIEILGEEK